jgi:hypothetical protein
VADWHSIDIPIACAYAAPGGSSAEVLVVAELSALSVWDPRIAASSSSSSSSSSAAAASGGGASGARPCVVRDTPSQMTQETFCAVAADGNTFAAAGSGGTVFIYDARTWKMSAKWCGPTKHRISGVAISEARKRIWVAGADQEVICGSWEAGGSSGGKRIGGGGGEGRGLHDGHHRRPLLLQQLLLPLRSLGHLLLDSVATVVGSASGCCLRAGHGDVISMSAMMMQTGPTRQTYCLQSQRGGMPMWWTTQKG